MLINNFLSVHRIKEFILMKFKKYTQYGQSKVDYDFFISSSAKPQEFP